MRHWPRWISTVIMKRRPYCVREMRARRKQKCANSRKVLAPTSASASPTCGHWQCWPPGRSIQSRPSTTCARPPGWQQTSACQENAGRSRRCWEGCMKQWASPRKHTQPLLRRPCSSRGWRRASNMRRCARTFWLLHRSNRCCSTPNASPTRFRKTMRSRAGVETHGALRLRMLKVNLLSQLPVRGLLARRVVVEVARLWPAPFTQTQLFAAWPDSDVMLSHWHSGLLSQRTFAQSHTVPLWNPYFGGGQPLGADPLAALFYPPTHLVHFFSLRDYYLVLILGHLVFTGLGMLLLARRAVGLPRLPALVAAISYMATPALLAHLGAGHVTIVQTVAWYPWLALACWATVREPRRWGALLGICIALLLLAGHPQMAYYGLLMTIILSAWLLVKRLRLEGWRALLASIAGLAAAGGGGGPLAAIHLLPLMQFTARSTRQVPVSSTDAYPLLSFLHALVLAHPPQAHVWESVGSPGLGVLVLAPARSVALL